MKPSISKIGQWARGLIYVAIAVLGALISDENFRTHVGPLNVSCMGATVAGLVALRAYLDQSTDAPKSNVPIEVTTPPNEPLKTVDVEKKNDE